MSPATAFGAPGRAAPIARAFLSRNQAPLPAARRASCARAASGSAGLSAGFDEGRGRAGVASTRQQPGSASRAADGEATSAERPLASRQTIEEAQSNARLFLTGELSRLFETGKLTRDKYSSDFAFEDPIAKYSGLDLFQTYLTALRALFKVDFVLHSTAVTGDTEITTRWTMEMTPRLTPWVQKLVFTGRSYYTLDPLSGGRLTSQRDTWDAVQDNAFPSLEGLAHVLAQLGSTRTAPKLDSPQYTVLRKTKEYEIRRYRPYLAASVQMPAGAKPAAGDGFNDLAGYIFGGNQRRERMEMTTPVFTSAGQAGQAGGGSMEFPMEERLGSDPQALPPPDSAKVTRVREEGGLVAVGTFGGWPLDYEVTEAERRLRGALLLDGLQAQPGYKLARYNDPFTPPFLRRNEVLIRLEAFELEPASA